MMWLNYKIAMSAKSVLTAVKTFKEVIWRGDSNEYPQHRIASAQLQRLARVLKVGK